MILRLRAEARETYMAFDENWTKVIGTRLSRRSALRGGVIGGAGLVAAALIGCGDDDDDDAAAPKAAAPLPTSTPKAAAWHWSMAR